MTIEDYEQVWSDYHKDAYGYRPRGPIPQWTIEQWAKEFDVLRRTCEANNADRLASEAKAALEVEVLIAKVMATGARDRATAIRWLDLANGTGGDHEYLCYCLGLRYGYFNAV